MVLPRRVFLLCAAAASAVLAVPPELRAAVPPAKARFDDDDRAILAALGRATFGEGADALDLPDAVQTMVAWLDDERQGLVTLLPGLFDELTRVLVPTGARWLDLDPEAREAALVDWETSALAFRRQVLQGLRQLLLAAAYVNPATFAQLGYAGPWKGRIEVPVHPPRFGPAS